MSRCCVVIYIVLVRTPVHSGSETVHVLQQQLPRKTEKNHVKTLVRIANLRITSVTVCGILWDCSSESHSTTYI